MAAPAIFCLVVNYLIEVVFMAHSTLKDFTECCCDIQELFRHRYVQIKQNFNQGSLSNKRLGHLGIVLPQEQGSMRDNASLRKRIVEDIANLAYWSIRAHIWTLTVYHRTELPPDIHWDIVSSVRDMLESSCSGILPQVKVTTLNSEFERLAFGEDGQEYLEIRLLSYADSKDPIVGYARHLKTLEDKNMVTEKSTTTEAIAQALNGMYGSPPDLIIVFGMHRGLNGYPPWYLKYAEIKVFPNIHFLRPIHFVKGLRHFANVEMRRGK